MRYHFILVRMVIIKNNKKRNLQTVSAGEELDITEPSYIAV